MKIIILLTLVFTLGFANNTNCYEWEGSHNTLSKEGKPYSTLWIYYCLNGNKIEGSYSFITLFGNRIDGEYNKNAKILNGVIDDNRIKIKFYNGFDNEWNNALLKINNDNALWTVLDETSWDTVKDYKLSLVQNTKMNKQILIDKLLIKADKAYLYSNNHNNAKTNIFFIKL